MGHLATKATPQSCYLGRVGASRSFPGGFHHKVPRELSGGELSPPAQVWSSPAPSLPLLISLPFLRSPTCLVSAQSLHRKQVEGEKYLQEWGTRSLILFYSLEFLCLRLAPGLPGSMTTYHIKQSVFFLLSGFLGNHERSVKNFVQRSSHRWLWYHLKQANPLWLLVCA